MALLTAALALPLLFSWRAGAAAETGRSRNVDLVRAYAAVSSVFVHGYHPHGFGAKTTAAYAFEGRFFSLYSASDVFFTCAVLSRRRGARDWWTVDECAAALLRKVARQFVPQLLFQLWFAVLLDSPSPRACLQQPAEWTPSGVAAWVLRTLTSSAHGSGWVRAISSLDPLRGDESGALARVGELSADRNGGWLTVNWALHQDMSLFLCLAALRLVSRYPWVEPVAVVAGLALALHVGREMSVGFHYTAFLAYRLPCALIAVALDRPARWIGRRPLVASAAVAALAAVLAQRRAPPATILEAIAAQLPHQAAIVLFASLPDLGVEAGPLRWLSRHAFGIAVLNAPVMYLLAMWCPLEAGERQDFGFPLGAGRQRSRPALVFVFLPVALFWTGAVAAVLQAVAAPWERFIGAASADSSAARGARRVAAAGVAGLALGFRAGVL